MKVFCLFSHQSGKSRNPKQRRKEGKKERKERKLVENLEEKKSESELK
jgi:hypothetical protein